MALSAIPARPGRLAALPLALILFTACERGGLDPFEPPVFPEPEPEPSALYTVERELIEDLVDVEKSGSSIFCRDDYDQVIRYRDGVVTRLTPPEGYSQLRGLLGDGEGGCYLVAKYEEGYFAHGALLFWEEGVWTELARGGNLDLRHLARSDDGRIWCSARNDLYEVVADDIQPVAAPALRDIDDIVAWGEGNLMLEHLSGTLAIRVDDQWLYIESDEEIVVRFCIHEGAPHIVADNGQFWRLTDLQLDPLDPLPFGNIHRASLASEDGILFMLCDTDVDSYGWETGLAVWEDDAWTTREVPAEINYYCVSATDDGKVIVGGSSGSLGTMTTDGTWDLIADRPGRDIYSLATRGDLWWAVGEEGFTLRKQGDEPWMQMPEAGEAQLRDIAIDHEGTAYVINGADDVIRRWNGESWDISTSGMGVTWLSLWSDGDGDIWAAGIGSAVAHLSGGVWELHETGIEGSFTDGVSEGPGKQDRIALVGSGGQVIVGQGGSWVEYDTGLNNYFTAATWGPDDELYVVGNPGLVWSTMGGGAVVYYDGVGSPRGVCFDPEGRLWIVGLDTLIATWSGGADPPVFEPEPFWWWLDYYTVTAAENGTVRIGGSKGRILLYEAE